MYQTTAEAIKKRMPQDSAKTSVLLLVSRDLGLSFLRAEIQLKREEDISIKFFSRYSSSSGFHLAGSTRAVLTPQVRELMWEFFQWLSISILIIHSRSREITTEWVLDHRPHPETHLS